MKLLDLRFKSTASVALIAVCAALLSSDVAAQDVNAGKLVYITPQVSGQLSCSAGACHTPNPALNQNRILKAADDPGAIGVALNTVTQMAFLKGKLTTQQFVDLAAYIGNPGAATGSPSAQINPESLIFPSTSLGASAPSQPFAIINNGSASLVVASVASNNPDFSLVSSCGAIAAGNSCNVSVGFTPAAAGARSGTISVSHNAAGGVSTVAVSGTGAAAAIPGIQVTPSSLDFGSVAVGSFSGSLTVAINSTGTAPLVITTISDSGVDFPLQGGICTIGAPIAVGASCTIVLRYVPSAEGVLYGTLAVGHNANSTAVTVSLTGTGTAASGPPATKSMVEYLYAPLNYYFVTSRDDDKTALDKIGDFQRTGLSFPVYASEVPGSNAITRFYFDQIAVRGSRGSHFYTLLDSDKAALVALNPNNAATPRLPVNEGVDSWAFLPIVSGPSGSCASGLTPVYRLFRGSARFPDDPNHRFTTSVATYDAFVALGWDGEGVNFCVPHP